MRTSRLACRWYGKSRRASGWEHIFAWRWASRVSWDRHGYFVNGSRWFSGWHRWAEDAEMSCGSTK